MEAFTRFFARYGISLSALLALVPSSTQGPSPQHVGSHLPIAPTLASGLEAPPDRPPASPETGSSCGGSEGPDEVYLHSGEVRLSAVDMRIPGVGLDVVIARKYRSGHGPSTALGHGWDFSYNLRVEAEWTGIRVHDGNTRSDLYTVQPNGKYAAAELFREGELELDGSFTLTFADGGTWSFLALDASPAAGRIASIADRNGNALGFGYDGLGRLVTITDTLGRDVALGYDADGYLESVTDWTGREVRYEHYQDGDAGGSVGDLKSVRTPLVTGTPNGNDFPAGKTTVYTYSKGFASERLNHNLLTVTDPRGQTWLTNVYAPTQNPRNVNFDRVVKQARGGASDTLELVYLRLLPAAPGDPALRVIANDPVGNVREYFYDAASRLVMRRELTGRAPYPGEPTTATANRPADPLRPDDPAYFETRWEHNADALVTRVVHPNGNETRRVYELELDPQAAPHARGNLRELRRLPGTHVPAGDQAELVELFEYAPGQGACGCGTSHVARHTDARGNVTEHSYDARGNRVQTVHRIPAIVEEFEYDGFGRLTAHVWPDNGSGHRRRDEYRFYGPADGAQNGYLKEEVVDAGGLELTTAWEYDAVGNVVRMVDPRGNDTLRALNALDQLVRELSPPVGGVRYERLLFYDANDNLVRLDVENRDESGVLQPNSHLTATWEYGILDEIVRATREAGSGADVVSEYAYDANRNRTLVRLPESVNGNQPANTVATLYDERDLVWREVRAEGAPEQSTTQRDWDANGNLKALRAGLEDGAHVTLRAYDAYDRLVSVSDAMGNLTEHHYDANGNLGGNQGEGPPVANPFGTRVLGELVDLPGSAGNVRLYQATYAYDALDRRVAEAVEHFDTETQAPIGDGQSTTTWTWTDDSQLASESGDSGDLAARAYDTAGRLSEVLDAAGNTLTLGYDSGGGIVSITELELSDLGAPSQMFTTTYAYDALGRAVTATDSAGNLRQRFYDSRGNLVLEIDARGNRTRRVFDLLDRPIETAHDMNGNGVFTDPADVRILEAWDDDSRRTARADGTGSTTRMAYDALDRRIVTRFADGTLEQVGSGAGWPSPSGPPDLSSFASGWDAHDREEVHVDANGTRIDSAYDMSDRLLSRTIARGPGVLGTSWEIYLYDGGSLLVHAEDDDAIVQRAHDSLGNVLRETQQHAPSGSLGTVFAEYDGESNPTRLIYPGGRTVQRNFDELKRPTSLIEEAGGATIASYAYVGRARIERRDHGNGTRASFTYDGISGVPNPPGDFGVGRVIRLTHSKIAGGLVLDDRSYVWDPESNQKTAADLLAGTTRNHGHDRLDRLVSSTLVPPGAHTAYVLDAAGNRTAVVGGADAGNYLVNAVHEYLATPFEQRAYDQVGNPVSATPPLRSYAYDYRNQLVQFFDSSTGLTTQYAQDPLGRRVWKDTGGAAVRYFYDGWQEIEEQDAAGVTLATHAYSKGLDGLVQSERSGQAYYLHEDENGSVRAITDAAGAIAARVDYGDFGAPGTLPACGVRFLFGGARYDEETKSYSLPGMCAVPRLGRFDVRAESPLLDLGNPYSLAGDDPVAAAGFDPWLLLASFEQDDGKSKGQEKVEDWTAFLLALKAAYEGVKWIVDLIDDLLHPDCGPIEQKFHFIGAEYVNTSPYIEGMERGSTRRHAEEWFEGDEPDSPGNWCKKKCPDLQCHGAGESCKLKDHEILGKREWVETTVKDFDSFWGLNDKGEHVRTRWVDKERLHVEATVRCNCKCEK